MLTNILKKLGIEPVHSKSMTRGEKINLIGKFLLFGLIIAVLFNAVLGLIMKLPHPYSTFLFTSEDSFKDFYNHVFAAKNLAPYAARGIETVYPPFTYLIFYLFSFFHPNYIGAFVYYLIFFSFFIYYVYSNLAGSGKPDLNNIIIFTFFSYPVLFAVDRGNIELYLFILLAIFVYAYKKGNMAISVIALSMAISMKMIPAVFLVLFIADKRYKELAWTMIGTAVISADSLLALHGGLLQNILGYLYWQRHLLNVYGLNEWGLHYSSSIYAPLRYLAVLIFPFWFGQYHINNVVAFFNGYNVASIMAAIFLSIYVISVEKTYWKKIFILAASMITLPYFSADYRLIHVFLPMFLFINYSGKDKKDLVYAIIFALLLIPKNYFFFSIRDMSSFVDISISIFINPALFILALYLIIRDGIRYKGKAEINDQVI